MIAGDTRRALLGDERTGEQVWVGRSEEIASWSVAEIYEDAIVVKHEAFEKRVSVYRP